MRGDLAVGVCLALCSAACSMQADFGSTGFRCDRAGRCPAGQSCVEGICRSGDEIPDAGADAGAVDPYLAPWAATSDLPAARDYAHQHAAVVNGFILFVGGYGGAGPAEVATVFHARVNGDGTLAAWQETTELPAPRALADLVVRDDVVYAIGGADGAVARTSVYYATVAGDGTIAEWTATTALPAARKAHGAVIDGDRIYVIGGGDESNVRADTVFVSEIQDDGALGAWMPGPPLPEPRANAPCLLVDGVIYVIGGDDQDEVPRTSVYRAQVDPEDGSLGAWSPTTELPSARRAGTAAHDAGYLYLIGGWTGSDTAEVLHARIEPNGALGAWETDTALPAARRRHATAVVDGRFYVLGGTDGASVLFADTPDP